MAYENRPLVITCSGFSKEPKCRPPNGGRRCGPIRPGLISTSSKVSASRGLALFFAAIANSISPEKEIETGCRRLIKYLSRGGPSPDVTARFWVGVGQ
jgi:hypothetical protein